MCKVCILVRKVAVRPPLHQSIWLIAGNPEREQVLARPVLTFVLHAAVVQPVGHEFEPASRMLEQPVDCYRLRREQVFMQYDVYDHGVTVESFQQEE